MKPAQEYLASRKADPIRAERIEAMRKRINEPAEGFWQHYCEAENEIICTEKGSPCNWCDTPES